MPCCELLLCDQQEDLRRQLSTVIMMFTTRCTVACLMVEPRHARLQLAAKNLTTVHCNAWRARGQHAHTHRRHEDASLLVEVPHPDGAVLASSEQRRSCNSHGIHLALTHAANDTPTKSYHRLVTRHASPSSRHEPRGLSAEQGASRLHAMHACFVDLTISAA
jgi:hypothetical protein